MALFRNPRSPYGPWTDAGALVVVDTDEDGGARRRWTCARRRSASRSTSAAGGRGWRAWAATIAIVDVHDDARRSIVQTVALDDGSGSPGDRPVVRARSTTNHAFVTAPGSGDLWVFDRASHRLERRIPLGSDAFPQRLALAPAMRRCRWCASTAAERLAAVSTATRSLVVDHDRRPARTRRASRSRPTDASPCSPTRTTSCTPAAPCASTSPGSAPAARTSTARADARVFPQAVVIVPLSERRQRRAEAARRRGRHRTAS